MFLAAMFKLIRAIANVYYPEAPETAAKYLCSTSLHMLRGTVDDLDQWMRQLSPVLNQVTVWTSGSSLRNLSEA